MTLLLLGGALAASVTVVIDRPEVECVREASIYPRLHGTAERPLSPLSQRSPASRVCAENAE